MSKQFGLLGKTLSHSFSPQIQSVIMDVINLNGTYTLIERQEHEIQALFEDFQWDGMNVTIPYKVTVMPFCDKITPEAKEIGAVNTIQKKKGAFIGHNTDYSGIETTLKKQGVNINHQRVVILGNGGASQAAKVYAKHYGASEIVVVSRRAGETDDSAIQMINYDTLNQLKAGYLLINATPVGMYPRMNATPIDATVSSRFEHVFDMIYNPLETQLLAQCRKTAQSCGNGLNMLIYQAIRAQEIWNQITISTEACDQIVKKVTERVHHA